MMLDPIDNGCLLTWNDTNGSEAQPRHLDREREEFHKPMDKQWYCRSGYQCDKTVDIFQG